MGCWSIAFPVVQGKTLAVKGLTVPTRGKHSVGRYCSKQVNLSPLPTCAQALQPAPILLSHTWTFSTLPPTQSDCDGDT